VKQVGQILILGLIMAAVSCTANKPTDEPVLPEPSFPITLDQADLFWSERMDSVKAKQALDIYFQLAGEDTLTIDLWSRLSRAYYYYGQFFDHDPIYRDSLFMQGYIVSQSILKQNSEYNNLLFSTGDEKMGILGLDEQYVDVLYWGMANYGRWLETKGPLVRLGQRDLVMATLEHIHDLDSSYYHGAYYRYKGALLTRDPSANQDTSAIRDAFETAIRIAPDYLGNYTFMAEYFCPRVKDKDLFYSLLTTVITSAPKPGLPYFPENEHEKKLAERLMLRAESETWF